MTIVIDGIYENGKITLKELPKKINNVDVKVIFEVEEKSSTPDNRNLDKFRNSIFMSDDFNDPLTELEEFWT